MTLCTHAFVVYICMCVCIHVCMYVCLCIYISTYLQYVYVRTCMCVYVRMYICTVCMFICTCVYMYVLHTVFISCIPPKWDVQLIQCVIVWLHIPLGRDTTNL